MEPTQNTQTIQTMYERIRRVEDRLERALAGGWRSAATDAADLAAEADALEGAGLPDLAAALRGVVAAPDAAAALPALTLAAAHCRLLRVRIAADEPPPGTWTPLGAPLPPSSKKKASAQKAPARQRLMPVARLAVGDGEAWVCVAIQGLYPQGLTLVTPPDGAPASPWLQATLLSHQRWQARYPLGASGSVELVATDTPAWDDGLPNDFAEHLKAFRQAWDKGGFKDGQPVFRYGGTLTVRQLKPEDLAACVWPDGPAPELLRIAMKGGPVWALVWSDGPLVMPLAVLKPGGMLWGKPRLVHLTRGLPEEVPMLE